MRMIYQWDVSEIGDIIISEVTTQDDGTSIQKTLTYIPAAALRYAVLNATGQGDGISRSGTIDT